MHNDAVRPGPRRRRRDAPRQVLIKSGLVGYVDRALYVAAFILVVEARVQDVDGPVLVEVVPMEKLGHLLLTARKEAFGYREIQHRNAGKAQLSSSH